MEIEGAGNGDDSTVGDLLVSTRVDRAVVSDVNRESLSEAACGGEGEGALVNVHIAGESGIGKGGGAAVNVDDAAITRGGVTHGAVNGNNAVGGDDAVAKVGVYNRTTVKGVGGSGESVSGAIEHAGAGIRCDGLVVGGGIGVRSVEIYNAIVGEGCGVGEGAGGGDVEDGVEGRGDVGLYLDGGDAVEATSGAQGEGAGVDNDSTLQGGVVGVENDLAGLGTLAALSSERIDH